MLRVAARNLAQKGVIGGDPVVEPLDARGAVPVASLPSVGGPPRHVQVDVERSAAATSTARDAGTCGRRRQRTVGSRSTARETGRAARQTRCRSDAAGRGPTRPAQPRQPPAPATEHDARRARRARTCARHPSLEVASIVLARHAGTPFDHPAAPVDEVFCRLRMATPPPSVPRESTEARVAASRWTLGRSSSACGMRRRESPR